MKQSLVYIVAFLTFIGIYSCEYFKPAKAPEAVARVGDEFLYKEDIVNLVPKGTSSQDSLAIVQSFINNWATKKLLLKGAELNLSEEKVEEYNGLINEYKTDLFTKGYMEQLVIHKVDTVVTDKQIEDFYEKNKNSFKNATELVKLRYINLVKENPKFDKIQTKFSSFTAKDKAELADLAIQFKSYAFNDSVWVDVNQVFEKLPFINLENKSDYVIKGKSFSYPDSTTVWLVKIKDVLPKDSVTPLQFIRPTVKQIIINKRKLDLVQKIENEITNDAIKDEKFEIYN